MANDISTSLIGISDPSSDKVSIAAEQKENIGNPSVYVPGRDRESSDIKELQLSAIVKIDRNTNESYICIHSVLQVVTERMDIKTTDLKWRPYGDTKFLFTFPNAILRDEFIKKHATIFISDACIKSQPFESNEGPNRSPMTFKVWVTIKGLPAQHLCFKTAQIITSRFGKLYACNGSKRQTFLGAYHVMVDCKDISQIPPYMDFYYEDDGKVTIEIKKDYACSVEAYESMEFDESELNYEDVIYGLLEQNKLTTFT